MFNKAKKLFVIPMIAVLAMFSLAFMSPVAVHAQDANANLLCKTFPFLAGIGIFGINDALCGTGDTSDVALETATATISLFQLVTSLIFIAIIIIAVYVIVKAAIKYIRSEGDESKVQEAQKAIKTVFIGIAALFIGILGVVLVLAFFQVAGPTAGAGGDGTGIEFIDNFIDAIRGE